MQRVRSLACITNNQRWFSEWQSISFSRLRSEGRSLMRKYVKCVYADFLSRGTPCNWPKITHLTYFHFLLFSLFSFDRTDWYSSNSPKLNSVRIRLESRTGRTLIILTGFYCFSSVLLSKFRGNRSIRLYPLPAESLPIHYSPVIYHSTLYNHRNKPQNKSSFCYNNREYYVYVFKPRLVPCATRINTHCSWVFRMAFKINIHYFQTALTGVLLNWDAVPSES
jgi:hypothetical protein